MIKIVDRYIMSTILGMTFLIFFIFLGLMIFISLSGEMKQLGEGAYTLWEGVQYVLLKLPFNLYLMFPNIALLGALLGLGSLASHSELTVMRVSGMSIFRLSFSVFLVAIVLIGMSLVVGEYFAPRLAEKAEKEKAYLKSNGQILSTEKGIWLRQNQAFIHIGTSFSRQNLLDITRYEVGDDFKLKRIQHADSAELRDQEWLMNNVITSEITFDKVTTTSEPTESWTMNVDLSDMDMSPDQLSLFKIYEQAQLRDENGIAAGSFWLAFWTRLFQPITTLIMVFLAIPFAFGSLRSVTIGLRLLSGVMIGLSFYLFNRFFGPFILAYQLPPILGALVPMGIFSVLMIFLMMRK